MSAVTPQSATDAFLARYEAAKATLPGDPEVRAAAAAYLRKVGLPGTTRGRSPEAWKYTSLRGMPVFGEAPTPSWVGLTGPADSRGSGGPVKPAHDGVGVTVGGAIQALNTLLSRDGASFHVPAGTDAGTAQIDHRANEQTTQHPHHRIVLEPNARLTVIETATGSGAYVHNPVIDVVLGQGAHLTHIRVIDEAQGAYHLGAISADLAESATYDSLTMTLGGALVRTEMDARLNGPNAVAHLNAVQLLDGTQHADFTSVVRHAAPHCSSRQTVKNVLNGRSRGVFQGRIEVARDAQKTDGYQMNQALLLSPDAEIDTKPELEIYADDVKCSHGATVGELDAEQLFYLRSRGVPESDARSILVRAFLIEALDAVADDAIRALLEQKIDAWWERLTA